ncbi:unnamed protein product [Symbiodinium sp. CCMP2456]|nr:unnamed protein product [Symbiodinium sp. CCMP2456]
MVLDLCPEFYVCGKENLLWQPEDDEHQRRCWLAPKPDVGAADPVAKKMPKAVPDGLATTVAPAALSSRYVQTFAGRELSRTYATAHSIAGCPVYSGTVPKSAVTLAQPPGLPLDRSRCMAILPAVQHPATIIKRVRKAAPRVTMRVVQPAAMPYMQVRFPVQPVYPMSRETSFLGGYPMAYSSVYVSNRVVLPPRVLVRPPEGWISVLLSGKPLAVVARGEAGASTPSKQEDSAAPAEPVATANGHEQDGEGAIARRAKWATWTPLPQEVWDNFPRAGDGGRPTSLGAFKKVVGEAAAGEFWGLNFPLSADQFLEMGPDWLTKAMHKAGTLPKDNRIVKFTDFDIKAAKTTESTESTEASWGGAGIKILLSVDYSREPVGDEPGKDMFVKMPHEFTGKNERFKISVTINGDWAETMFYNMLSGKLPVKTPRIFFADMNRRTTNFIWVMERIPYGSDSQKSYGPGEILPPAGKYRDWMLKDACEMYYAHSRALARFFGWFYHTNQTTNQVAECFGHPAAMKTMHEIFDRVRPLNPKARDAFYVKCLADPKMAPVVESLGLAPAAAESFLAMAESFIRNVATHCFPKKLVEEATLKKALNEAKEIAKHSQEIAFYMQMIPEYYTLAHPNAQIDNAIFWRDGNGIMECGLIDWGGAMVGMPIPTILAGSWLGAEPDFMDEHEQKLVKCFANEYKEVTGVNLDPDLLYMDYKLSQGYSLPGVCANVQWCTRLATREQWKGIKDRFDKQIDDVFLMRCYYVQIEFVLALLRTRSPYPLFLEFMKRTGMKKKP